MTMRAVETGSGGPLDVDDPTLLVRRVGEGDAAAEERVVALFERRVFGVMYSRTRNVEAARDLSQEALMAVVTALRTGRVREPERLAAFVLGTARNVANYFLRARYQDPPTVPVSPEVAAVDPRHAMETADRVATVRRLLDSLDATDREILTLTLVEGLKPGEIAGRLGLRGEAVRTRKSRAVQKVAEALRGRG